jgi:class 3 adenylate cyclase/tetratricopeptide (TPR) repeat protein
MAQLPPADNGDSSDRPPPERVGRYRILKLLGRGGMGAVWLAHDAQLDRNVALKVPHFDRNQGEALERFHREARIAGRLQHPNICPVYDVGEADGVHYLSMAFIEGETLSARIPAYARRPPSEAARLVRTLALALGEAHQRGVIHRDLKPANVMIDARGEPIVMDFGLAREFRGSSALQTHPGTILGTPAYMAPEQARGDVTATGPATDIYSLGILLYELLVGRIPFDGPTMDVLVRQVRDEPVAPSQVRAEVDPHIEAICLKAMAKEPSRRFLSMGDFAAGLDDYLAGRIPTATPQLLPSADPLERAAAEVLLLFRTWGAWTALKRLRARFTSAEGEKGDARVDLLLRWVGGDPAVRDEAGARLHELRQFPALAGWALLSEVCIRNRDHDFARVDLLLREATAQGDRRDNILQAAIAHQRGFRLYHTGDLAESLAALHQGLDLCGRDHFLTTQILDTLGLVYSNKNNFQAAHELFEQALLLKERFEGISPASGLRQLGQLYLDWGDLERAEEVLKQALQCSLRLQDEHGQADAFHYLGRVNLALGEREIAAGRRAPAQRKLAQAAEWLDAGLRIYRTNNRPIAEGAGHRDRALVCLTNDDLEGAVEHARLAGQLFGSAGHAEGMARVREVQGIIARHQGNTAESERLLRQALAHFDKIADYLEATRTQLEIARTLRAGQAPKQLVIEALLDALTRAEECRRPGLVRTVEEELKGIDEEAHWRHVFRRSRGRSAGLDTSSLTEGVSELASVLFLNLKGFVAFCQGMEPEEVMQTLNQLLADLGAVLERYDAHILTHLGGGFMALARGSGHAARAVDAALDMIAVVDEFNSPRTVLGLPQLPVCVSIATGPVCLGNIGTYRKMDFTVVGAAVNLAARLVRQANERQPCISREVREVVGQRFAVDGPRAVDLEGLGRCEVWDVLRRREAPSRPRR